MIKHIYQLTDYIELKASIDDLFIDNTLKYKKLLNNRIDNIKTQKENIEEIKKPG